VKVWVDAQLPPGICGWLNEHFGIDAVAVRDFGLRDAEDRKIFDEARKAGVAILTKDSDFVGLVAQLGPPPQVLR
jgi:predicted nuclease of predicted toxin-antitoxin system